MKEKFECSRHDLNEKFSFRIPPSLLEKLFGNSANFYIYFKSLVVLNKLQ